MKKFVNKQKSILNEELDDGFLRSYENSVDNISDLVQPDNLQDMELEDINLNWDKENEYLKSLNFQDGVQKLLSQQETQQKLIQKLGEQENELKDWEKKCKNRENIIENQTIDYLKELNHFREMKYHSNATEIKLFNPDSLLNEEQCLLMNQKVMEVDRNYSDKVKQQQDLLRDLKNEVHKFKRIFKLLKNYNSPASLIEVVYLLNPKFYTVYKLIQDYWGNEQVFRLFESNSEAVLNSGINFSEINKLILQQKVVRKEIRQIINQQEKIHQETIDKSIVQRGEFYNQLDEKDKEIEEINNKFEKIKMVQNKFKGIIEDMTQFGKYEKEELEYLDPEKLMELYVKKKMAQELQRAEKNYQEKLKEVRDKQEGDSVTVKNEHDKRIKYLKEQVNQYEKKFNTLKDQNKYLQRKLYEMKEKFSKQSDRQMVQQKEMQYKNDQTELVQVEQKQQNNIMNQKKQLKENDKKISDQQQQKQQQELQNKVEQLQKEQNKLQEMNQQFIKNQKELVEQERKLQKQITIQQQQIQQQQQQQNQKNTVGNGRSRKSQQQQRKSNLADQKQFLQQFKGQESQNNGKSKSQSPVKIKKQSSQGKQQSKSPQKNQNNNKITLSNKSQEDIGTKNSGDKQGLKQGQTEKQKLQQSSDKKGEEEEGQVKICDFLEDNSQKIGDKKEQNLKQQQQKENNFNQKETFNLYNISNNNSVKLDTRKNSQQFSYVNIEIDNDDKNKKNKEIINNNSSQIIVKSSLENDQLRNSNFFMNESYIFNTQDIQLVDKADMGTQTESQNTGNKSVQVNTIKPIQQQKYNQNKFDKEQIQKQNATLQELFDNSQKKTLLNSQKLIRNNKNNRSVTYSSKNSKSQVHRRLDTSLQGRELNQSNISIRQNKQQILQQLERIKFLKDLQNEQQQQNNNINDLSSINVFELHNNNKSVNLMMMNSGNNYYKNSIQNKSHTIQTIAIAQQKQSSMNMTQTTIYQNNNNNQNINKDLESKNNTAYSSDIDKPWNNFTFKKQQQPQNQEDGQLKIQQEDSQQSFSKQQQQQYDSGQRELLYKQYSFDRKYLTCEFQSPANQNNNNNANNIVGESSGRFISPNEAYFVNQNNMTSKYAKKLIKLGESVDTMKKERDLMSTSNIQQKQQNQQQFSINKNKI